MSDPAVISSAFPASRPDAPGPADPFLYRIRDLVHHASGIYHPENKFYFLQDRCAKRMAAVGARSLVEYLDCLSLRDTRETELRALLNEVTVGETCFFRNQPQLDAVLSTVIPAVVEAKAKLGFTRFRVWSAGCATGEEPYTLAMFLLEQTAGLLKGWTIEVIATDLNDISLGRARDGVYNDYALRNIPPYFKQKYMRPADGLYRVRDDVKACVSFSRLNLVDDSRMVFLKGTDVVFCCNVLIYFSSQSKRRVIQHFFNNLLPGGYLFLGHSESLFGLNDDFQLLHFPLATAYRKPPRKVG